MNDLDLCLEVVNGRVNHCVTFDVVFEYLGNRTDTGLTPKGSGDSTVGYPSDSMNTVNTVI